MVEIRVTAKEGFNADHHGSNFIVLNTTLTEDLINEPTHASCKSSWKRS